jgi:hypothetical protein
MLAELTRIEHEAQKRGLHEQILELQQQAGARKERDVKNSQADERTGMLAQLKATRTPQREAQSHSYYGQQSQNGQPRSPPEAPRYSQQSQQSQYGNQHQHYSQNGQPRSPPDVSTHEQEVQRFKRDLARINADK